VFARHPCPSDSPLESQFAFTPVLVEIKADLTICLSSLSLDEKGKVFPKALKDLWDPRDAQRAVITEQEKRGESGGTAKNVSP